MDCLDSSLLIKTEHTSFCPIKGAASYYSYSDIENAIWSYEDPTQGVEGIKGYFGFDLRKGFETKSVN